MHELVLDDGQASSHELERCHQLHEPQGQLLREGGRAIFGFGSPQPLGLNDGGVTVAEGRSGHVSESVAARMERETSSGLSRFSAPAIAAAVPDGRRIARHVVLLPRAVGAAHEAGVVARCLHAHGSRGGAGAADGRRVAWADVGLQRVARRVVLWPRAPAGRRVARGIRVSPNAALASDLGLRAARPPDTALQPFLLRGAAGSRQRRHRGAARQPTGSVLRFASATPAVFSRRPILHDRATASARQGQRAERSGQERRLKLKARTFAGSRLHRRGFVQAVCRRKVSLLRG